MVSLGVLLLDTNEPANEAEAVTWLQKAADAADADAMCHLANAILNQRGGLKLDLAKAAKLAEKAANAGHAGGMDLYGFMLRQGDGVTKNLPESVQWFTKAAELADRRGVRHLAEAYTYGIGVKADPARAWSLYLKAAEMGEPAAMKEVGLALKHHEKYDEAVPWLRRAVEAGDTEAMIALGELHIRDKGVTREKAVAIELYRKAWAKGTTATKAMAIERLKGLGVDVAEDRSEQK